MHKVMVYVGRMALGKQVTTYLRGSVADGYEQALEKEGKSSYAMLVDAVEEYLANRGLLPVKKRFIPPPGMGYIRRKYEEELALRVDAVFADAELLRAVLARHNEQQPGKVTPAVRRKRRRPTE